MKNMRKVGAAMRYSREHKTRTRQRIIESAFRLFTAKGYAATSIEEIMQECGLTRGGFYAHFRSKGHLYHEAITCAAARGELLSETRNEEPDRDSIEALLDEYLNPDAIAGSDVSPRLAFLITDIASRETEVRSAYTQAFRSMSERILGRLSAEHPCGEESILSMAAMIIGTLAVAQTTDDAALRAKLFAACKESAKALVEHSGPHQRFTFFWAPERGATHAPRLS